MLKTVKHLAIKSGFFASLRMTTLLIVLLCSQTITSQPFTKDEKEILQLTDTRSIGKDKELLKFLNSGTAENEYMTALALANIGDTTVIYEIGNKLIKPVDSYVSHNLAFALGELNSHKGAEYLLQSLNKNNGIDDKMTRELMGELLNNLGRVGDESDLNAVTALTTNDDVINPYIALAIARFGMRKIKNDNSFRKLAGLMEQSADSTVHKFVAFAFARIGDKQSLEPFKSNLLSMIASYEPFTRMWSYSALGKLQDTSLVEKFLYELDIEADWRVRVNICNALGNQVLPADSPLREKVTTALLQHAFEDNSAHVSITALIGLAKLNNGLDTKSPLAKNIQQTILSALNPNKSIDWQIKAEAIRTYAKIFKDEAKDDLFSLFSQTDNYDIKSAVVGSFGSMENAMLYKELRDSISNDVMRYNAIHPNKDGSMIGSPDLAKMYKAFVEALAELDNRLDDENRNIIRLIFSEFASSKHPAIVDLCLTNLQDSMYLQYRGETCQIMMFDYEGFTYPKDKDVTIMYIQAWGSMKYDGAKDILTKNLKHTDYDIAKASADALKEITGKDYESKITAPKYHTDFDWNFIDNLGNNKIATIRTSRGDIKIEMFTNIAPFTVQNFVKLGEKGFYNNTIFHRVVPNFVIQGGDPTGTGFGGPAYSIRSEFSPLPFDAYTVGMASSGKDTEGSQFFITHSPQPHLDGKYTLFGKVIEGFDVVDRIQIGDVIESVNFSAN